MKALVALLCVAVVSSTHVLVRRSLLGIGQDHEHHHAHHDEHERTGRDSPVSAPEGYLPPADDDYADYDDDSAGFGAGKGDSTNSNARGFGQQSQASENQQSQYGQNTISPEIGPVENSLGRQSANGRNQQDGNQRVKFGQRINQNFQNTGLTRQPGSRKNPEGRGRNQQKAKSNNQFDLENDQDGSLGTYGNEIDQNLNNQQQDRTGSQSRQESNQRGLGINSQFDNLEDYTDQSQYGQHTGGTNNGPSGNTLIGQLSHRHQFGQQGRQNENQAGEQINQQQEQGNSLQREENQFGQGNRQTQSSQFSQGGNGQQQGQGSESSFGNQQVQSQSDVAGYGAAGQGQGNNNSQNGQNQIGGNQKVQNQKGQNKRGQNQRGQNQVEFNQGNSGGNQQVQGQSADDSYGAPGQGQNNNKSQNGQNQRGQSQRGQNQTGQNKIGKNQRGQNQRAHYKRGQNQPGQSQIGKQNQAGFSQGHQEVQDMSADKSYGAPCQGQTNNRFQIGQNQRGHNQRGQTQQGQNLGGQNDKRQNQREQNQRAFPSEFDSSIGTRPTINRFLPSSQDNQVVNNGYGAPSLRGQNIQGQNSHGGQSGQNSQRIQTGGERNGSTGNSFAAQGVQPGTGTNGFPFSSTESNQFEDKFQLENTLICPGGTIESCIKVCPGNTALLYGGCVQGCAERCDAQGQGGPQFGQQGIPGQNVQLGQQGVLIISGQANQSQGVEDQQGQYGQQNT